VGTTDTPSGAETTCHLYVKTLEEFLPSKVMVNDVTAGVRTPMLEGRLVNTTATGAISGEQIAVIVARAKAKEHVSLTTSLIEVTDSLVGEGSVRVFVVA